MNNETVEAFVAWLNERRDDAKSSSDKARSMTATSSWLTESLTFKKAGEQFESLGRDVQQFAPWVRRQKQVASQDAVQTSIENTHQERANAYGEILEQLEEKFEIMPQ